MERHSSDLGEKRGRVELHSTKNRRTRIYLRTKLKLWSIIIDYKCARSQLRKRYLYIVHSRPKLRTRVWPSCGLEEIILCSLKVIYIVCYSARVPVCVCDGRTILFCPVLGVFCDNNNNDARAQQRRELTNNSSDNYSTYVRR